MILIFPRRKEKETEKTPWIFLYEAQNNIRNKHKQYPYLTIEEFDLTIDKTLTIIIYLIFDK